MTKILQKYYKYVTSIKIIETDTTVCYTLDQNYEGTKEKEERQL